MNHAPLRIQWRLVKKTVTLAAAMTIALVGPTGAQDLVRAEFLDDTAVFTQPANAGGAYPGVYDDDVIVLCDGQASVPKYTHLGL